MAKSEEPELFQIFNTMMKQKETFKPIIPGHVSMYVCGVTAYDHSHIGHARAYIAFDVLYRYLKHLGYKVKYVTDFTDVDDKVRCGGCAKVGRRRPGVEYDGVPMLNTTAAGYQIYHLLLV